MTGPKLNEANRVAGTKSGSKASAKYVRSSASKARVVLNLVRNQDVRTADEILQFTDREMARVVRKVLASAVANATTNDLLDADELFVKACFADEGPTLKRFRPRAKGRAGKINKRTCHITVIVDRMSDDQLAVREAKTMTKGAPTSNRRARVAASRKAAEPAQEAPAAEAPAEDTTSTEEAGN
ncbi:MAG: 50S ribosomal protein L22 [Acidimicrobiaceae bacterium]|jgi:large subunit ribosomal protein L22